MSNVPHTPGRPWSIKGPSRPMSSNPLGGDYAIVDDKGEIIGEAFARVSPEDDGARPAEANARLMAAAPELLEVLQLFCYPEGGSKALCERFDRAREAIRMASGKPCEEPGIARATGEQA